MLDIRSKLIHAVTAFDRGQAEKAAKSKRGYYNHYALGQYLARVADIVADIEGGATIAAAIEAGFTPGPLRNSCLKAVGEAVSNRESAGSYLGMPVYSPASKREG